MCQSSFDESLCGSVFDQQCVHIGDDETLRNIIGIVPQLEKVSQTANRLRSYYKIYILDAVDRYSVELPWYCSHSHFVKHFLQYVARFGQHDVDLCHYR